MIENSPDIGNGSFAAPYRAFLTTVTELRPRLHRYCARMTGSAMDGEDVVQEALSEAYRKLAQFDDSRPLRPWLFRIAHNRCIDFLRRRGVRREAETKSISAAADTVMPVDPAGPDTPRAVEHLVLTLPPKERACLLLKDVLDHSLEEIAAIVDSTEGGVKAALVRGRTKLAASPPPTPSAPSPNPELAQLIRLYVDRFNRRDWDAVRELISADARLQVADRYAGRLSSAPYFGIYEKLSLTLPWKMAVGEVDGEPVVIILRRGADDAWKPLSLIRLVLEDHRIARIADYHECPWILGAAIATRHATS
jgi:RNA polymerase sigma-70 factor (ECF subfamily)